MVSQNSAPKYFDYSDQDGQQGEQPQDQREGKVENQSSTVESTSRRRKSAGAFRTISEVADELDVQQHVLRFWETKFTQVRPLKRGGGRRYYRPEDVAVLQKIHHLLYTEGYTIKGVQKLLKGQGKSQIMNDVKAETRQAANASNMANADAQPHSQATQPSTPMAQRPERPLFNTQQKGVLRSILQELKDIRAIVS